MDVLDVKEICSTSEGSDSAGSDLSDEETAGPAMRQKNEVVQNTVSFDDEEKKRAGKRQKDETENTKGDWLSEEKTKRQQLDTDGELDTSGIKTEPESDSE
ncbi:unnamed protein product [Gongylonema pulchrum]|uniref:Cilia- and flagella-associated protein 251-like n=1 Tax=Gongylonema pulchrum TaxID=637853 RepID=A0A183DUT9_9BILA|nr:unnamed protein product [Gongylonema pulchrum]